MPPFIILSYVVLADRFREPTRDILFAFFVGVLIIIPAGILNEFFIWQNDYLFAGKKLYDACTSSQVIDDPSLYEISDHNPIIAEFDLSLVNQ